jgi:pimeloyl-ACP methyl ester carboxylesterase
MPGLFYIAILLSMNVVVNGLMANYQKVGKGTQLVFLHGWGDSGATFSKLVEKLQDRYQILVLDLPGFGGTQTPPNAWGMDDYVDFIVAWLDKIGVKKPEAFVGHSYGGAAAIMGLGNNNLAADKLVLIASAGIRNKRPLRKKLLKAGAKTAKLPLLLLPKSKRQRIRGKVYKSLGSDMLLLPHIELTFKRIIGEDVQAAAAKIVTPTLLIYGTKDKDTPSSDGHTLNRIIDGSKLEVIDGGHFLHQEKSEQVARLIDDFLSGGKSNA